MDFLLPEPYGASGRRRVSPVEVKSSRRYGTASLDEIERRYGSRGVLGESYVLAPRAPKIEGARLTLPLFYASRIWRTTRGLQLSRRNRENFTLTCRMGAPKPHSVGKYRGTWGL